MYDTWNIKLNSMGSLKSLLVTGDLILNFLRVAACSSLVAPSSLVIMSSHSAFVSAVHFLSAHTFSSAALIRWSSQPSLQSST